MRLRDGEEACPGSSAPRSSSPARAQLRHPEDRDRRGPDRARRRHPQRPRAVGGLATSRPRHPLPDRPRRAPHRGHLAVPLPRRLLAARAGDHGGHRRGRHGAVGHQGQGGGPAALPAARRREPRRGDGLRPRQRRRRSTRPWTRRRTIMADGLQGDAAAGGRAGPGLDLRRLAATRMFYEPADAALPTENVWSTEKYLPFVPELFEAARARRSAGTSTCCTTCTTG